MSDTHYENQWYNRSVPHAGKANQQGIMTEPASPVARPLRQPWTRFIIAGASLLLLVLLVAIGSAFAMQPRELHFVGNTHPLRGEFLATWQQHQGDSLGQPRTDPIWLDGQLVQLFDLALLAAVDTTSRVLGSSTEITVSPRPAGWLAAYPATLLEANAAPQRARLTVLAGTEAQAAPSAPPVAAPLQPLTLRVRVANYSGPAELRLYDTNLKRAGSAFADITDGRGTFEVLPRGAPGRHWAIVLIDQRVAGAFSNLFTLEPVTTIETGQPDLDAIYPMVRGFLEQDVVSYELDGTTIRGYRSPDNPLIWLRDHVYQGRGYRYQEADMTSALDAFRNAQREDGSFPDVLSYPALGIEGYRMDPESDLEFLFVQGVYEAWQVTGDDAWLASNLEAMRRGLTYIMSDPLRWDANLGLVRRPYTIDMWDFEYGPSVIHPITGQPAPRHWFDEQTRWGIFHGDNTGLAYALRLMARIEEHLGNETEAAYWTEQRRAITRNIKDLSWNGDFFTHFVPLEGTLEIPGLDTDAQLSLSNAYALNREILDRDNAQKIIMSYFNRRDFERSFAEWYSIDPPFPSGSYGMGGRPGDDPGEYVNGGIMPLVGGELARGAFNYGMVDYGFDIIQRYAALLQLTGQSYLWYYPTGAPGISGPDTIATDGWGSSAMLAALIEGAAGVEDQSSLYRDLKLSPRWAAHPDINRARIVTHYPASGAYVAYTWERAEKRLTLDVTGTWERARIYLLLPTEGVGKQRTISVRLDGEVIPTQIDKVQEYRYVVVPAEQGNALVEVEWQ